jgi:hypothetical protein
MQLDLGIDHGLLAAADLRHISFDALDDGAEGRGVARNMRDMRAPNFILGRKTCYRGAGAPDPTAFDDGNLLARFGKSPSKPLSALAATEDDDIEIFRLIHVFPSPQLKPGSTSLCIYRAKRELRRTARLRQRNKLKAYEKKARTNGPSYIDRAYINASVVALNLPL